MAKIINEDSSKVTFQISKGLWITYHKDTKEFVLINTDDDTEFWLTDLAEVEQVQNILYQILHIKEGKDDNSILH